MVAGGSEQDAARSAGVAAGKAVIAQGGAASEAAQMAADTTRAFGGNEQSAAQAAGEVAAAAVLAQGMGHLYIYMYNSSYITLLVCSRWYGC